MKIGVDLRLSVNMIMAESSEGVCREDVKREDSTKEDKWVVLTSAFSGYFCTTLITTVSMRYYIPYKQNRHV